MRPLAFPFRVDRTGRTATASPDEEIQQLIEQVLFVIPGERVMRPTLGSGVGQLVFAPASDQMAAAAQHLIQGALQTWLGERITIESVQVTAEDATLMVSIRYQVRLTAESRTLLVRGQV